jgi:hypothetical protein
VPDRAHDVSDLTAAQLERARRDLEVSLALTWQGSPVRVSIAAEMSAIDAELAGRDMIRVCSCGFATDDDEWLGAPGRLPRSSRARCLPPRPGRAHRRAGAVSAAWSGSPAKAGGVEGVRPGLEPGLPKVPPDGFPQETPVRGTLTSGSPIRSAVMSEGDRDRGLSPPGWLRHQGVSDD